MATEAGILHEMQKQSPSKQSPPAPRGGLCLQQLPLHEAHHAEKLYLCLRDLPRIELDEELRLAALKPMDAMLALG